MKLSSIYKNAHEIGAFTMLKSNILIEKCLFFYVTGTQLTLSWGRPLSYRNQSIDLQSKSMDWFLYGIASVMKKLKSSLQ